MGGWGSSIGWRRYGSRTTGETTPGGRDSQAVHSPRGPGAFAFRLTGRPDVDHSMRRTGEHRMSAVRQWVGGFIVVAGTAAVAPRVMAQQEGTTPDSVPLA